MGILKAGWFKPLLRVALAVFCLLHVCEHTAIAQKQGHALADSLHSALALAPAGDSSRALILAELSNVYSGIQPDSGIAYGLQALKLAEEKQLVHAQALASYYLGFNYYNKSDYPAALSYLFRALNGSETIRDEAGIANASRKIGNIYRDQKQYAKALSYYNKALLIFERNGELTGVGRCFSNIGEIYCAQHNTEEAIRFQKKAIDIHQKVGYHNGVVIAQQRLAEAYLLDSEYGQALYHDLQAMATIERNRPSIAIEQVQETMGALGKVYLLMARADTAGRDSSIRQSIYYLDSALRIAGQMGHLTDMQSFHYHLAEAYALVGAHHDAYTHLQQSYKLSNKLFSAGNIAQIEQLEQDREQLLKGQIARLQATKARNERVAIIAGFAALIIILGLGFRSYRQQRKSNRIISSEKQRSDALLRNILPTQVAEELKEHGSTKARHFEEVTVLFTDFVAFTTAAERMSTQELVDELDHCFKAFDRIIDQYGMEKIKTIGDAYLAVGGLEGKTPGQAHRVVQAAIAIRDFMQQRQSERGNRTFGIRAGINTGPVVAGVVGLRKFAYDIWGDTVNTAARMEQSSEAGRINISGSTYELVKDEIPCVYRGKIAAKNKGEIDMYFVV